MSESVFFMQRLGFPAEAIEALESVGVSLQAQTELLPLLHAAEESILCHG